MNPETAHKSPMESLAAFIVDKRNLIFFFYIAAMIFSVFSQGWVNVENDITAYLPEDTETRQGLSIMEEELTTYGTARVVVSHASRELAETLADRMGEIEGITSAAVGPGLPSGEDDEEDLSDYIRGSDVLINVTFDGEAEDEISLTAMDELKALLEPYDAYISSDVGSDAAGNLASEMRVILVIAFIVIVLVLLFTSRSYAELPVLMLTFGSAALLNMGTNFIFGTISFVSNSVTVVLQLALLLAGSLAAPALAAEGGTVHIRTAQDLADLSRSCSVDGWSVGKTVYLDADIDLSGTEFQPIPIFCGTFYGQGHTVSGFSLTGSGDDRGFFRYVRDGAVVQDLTVSGSVSPSDRKDNIGGLVGVNSGSLLNCAFYGNVKAGTNAGGLVGCNRPTGQIINCTYSGTLLGEHYVGGITGQNEGSVIRCRNDGDVNVTEVKTTVAIQEVDLSTIRSTESVPACTDIGGIAGASSGILQSCTNNGDVGYEHVGYNVGGIAGRQSGWLDSCVNNGTVRGRKDVGGICGQMEPRLTLLFDANSLDDLWEELDTLRALMDQAISHAEGVSDDLSGRMTGLTDSADAVKDAASDLSDAMADWADGNIESINDAAARVSWVLDRLEPISDAADAALERIRDAADLADDALDAADRIGGLSEDALADVRLALEQVKSAAQACSDALDDVRAALEKLRASIPPKF